MQELHKENIGLREAGSYAMGRGRAASTAAAEANASCKDKASTSVDVR